MAGGAPRQDPCGLLAMEDSWHNHELSEGVLWYTPTKGNCNKSVAETSLASLTLSSILLLGLYHVNEDCVAQESTSWCLSLGLFPCVLFPKVWPCECSLPQ